MADGDEKWIHGLLTDKHADISDKFPHSLTTSRH